MEHEKNLDTTGVSYVLRNENSTFCERYLAEVTSISVTRANLNPNLRQLIHVNSLSSREANSIKFAVYKIEQSLG